mgnify:CR=1 FL=1
MIIVAETNLRRGRKYFFIVFFAKFRPTTTLWIYSLKGYHIKDDFKYFLMYWTLFNPNLSLEYASVKQIMALKFNRRQSENCCSIYQDAVKV